MTKPKPPPPPAARSGLAAPIAVRLSAESLAEIDRRVVSRQRENPGLTRADVVRELVGLGLRKSAR